ncbi:MAG: PilZ domain-containing protein, partial [Deltaproteobacteria bacterium]|nr:PilZ domain-containing protein [Deltaproteobacteria bacterium]
MDDKRQHTRVKDPTVVVKIATVDKFRSYYLSDLSAGGVFIRSEKLLAMNTEMDVKLIAPGLTEPLLLHGRIVRLETDEAARKANRVGMGVKFENLAPASAERLASLVVEHSQAKADAEAAAAALAALAGPPASTNAGTPAA